MKRIFAAILALFCAAPQAFATDWNAFRGGDADCPHCWPLEIDKLAAMMSDDVLRDLMCRLSSESYTAGALSRALDLPETQILRRIDTLREWGLVRWETPLQNGGVPSKPHKVVGAAPGKGKKTLRRWSERYCRNDGACGMDDHFSRVAADYNSLRYTDMEPIRYLKDRFTGLNYTKGIDIGCGAGRYSLLLLQNLPNLKLVCGDVNEKMLRTAEKYLKDHGQDSYYTQKIDANQLSFTPGSLDCIFMFNTIHHMDAVQFLNGAAPQLKTGGRIFVYTRFNKQNANSIWGKYFPKFMEKETRMSDRERVQQWAKCLKGLTLEDIRYFTYKRISTIDDLVNRAANHNYSTFELYEPDEFKEALFQFQARLKLEFPNPDHVEWEAGNVMLVFRRIIEPDKEKLEVNK